MENGKKEVEKKRIASKGKEIIIILLYYLSISIVLLTA